VVAARCDTSELNCRYVLQPNRSLNARGFLIFLFSLFAVYAAIGIPFALMGLWLILPFAGVELLAIGFCLRIAMVRSNQREVITVDGDEVTVESARPSLRNHRTFKRTWVQVRLVSSTHRWYPSRLTIGSHGSAIEVGSFLNEEERQEFAAELKRVVGLAGENPAANHLRNDSVQRT